MTKMDTTERLLKELDLHYERSGEILTLKWKTDHFDNLVIKIHSNNNESWLYIIALFNKFTEIQESVRLNLAIEMLKASWKYNGISFALSPEDEIIVLSETNDTELTAEELHELILGVVFGADTLWTIFNSIS